MYQNTYKYIQVSTGETSYEFEATGLLHVVVLARGVNKAHISIRVILKKPGAHARITGIVVSRGDEQITLSTTQVHEAPDTTSDLLVKTVLSDRARCFYDGAIQVEKHAQKTNAYQRNENLLLSGRAYAESKPSLEILANDVRCTHGSTTGPINEDELWYLSTRGIKKKDGERLIVEGFVTSALMRIDDRRIMSKLWQTLYPSI